MSSGAVLAGYVARIAPDRTVPMRSGGNDGGLVCMNLHESDDVRYHTEVIAAQCKWSSLIPLLEAVCARSPLASFTRTVVVAVRLHFPLNERIPELTD